MERIEIVGFYQIINSQNVIFEIFPGNRRKLLRPMIETRARTNRTH